MQKRKLYLCIGAQKAGTSWLHSYINRSSSDEFDVSKKELHIWDEFFSSDWKVRCVGLLSSIFRGDYLRVISLIMPARFYLDYVIKNSNSILIDFTPSYSLLRRRHLRYIKSCLEDKVDVKVLFVCRDPVDRCISGFKFNIAKSKTREGACIRKSIDESFIDYFKGVDCVNRTAYSRIIPNIIDVFGSKNALFLRYETMFSDPALDKIDRFFDFEGDRGRIKLAVNKSQSKIEISSGAVSECKNFYAKEYTFLCKSIFNQIL
jgi:hypothetical protein